MCGSGRITILIAVVYRDYPTLGDYHPHQKASEHVDGVPLAGHNFDYWNTVQLCCPVGWKLKVSPEDFPGPPLF